MRKLKRLLSIVLVLVLTFTTQLNVFAADLTNITTGESTNQLVTSTDGSNSYSFVIPRGSMETIMPINVQEKGMLFCYLAPSDEATLYNFVNSDIKPEIIVSLYKDEACTEANLIESQTCEYIDTYQMYGFYAEVATEGNYYLKVSISNSVVQNNISCNIMPCIFSGADRELTDGEAVYTSALTADPIYYKVTASKKGILGVGVADVSDDAKNNIQITLCDANKKDISKTLDPSDSNNLLMYAVEKGVYYFKVSATCANDDCLYTLSSKFMEQSVKSSSSKKNAIAITLGKSEIDGMKTATSTTSDWYKVKVTKSKKLTINVESYMNSGDLVIEVYNSKNQKIKFTSDTEVGTQTEIFETKITKLTSSKLLENGTYYIKISKNNKLASGIYDISVK